MAETLKCFPQTEENHYRAEVKGSSNKEALGDLPEGPFMRVVVTDARAWSLRKVWAGGNEHQPLGTEARQNWDSSRSSDGFFKIRVTCAWLPTGNDLFWLIYDSPNLERDKSWQLKNHFEK